MSDTGVQPVAEVGSGLSQWERVADTFTAPSKTFTDIKNGHRSWWMPLVILAIVGYGFFWTVNTKIGMGHVVDNQISLNPKTAERVAQLPPEQQAAQKKISIYITEGIFYGGPVMLLILGAVVALVLWGTINLGFGGRATFGGVFAVWMYSMLPSVIKTILGVVVIYAGAAPESFNIKNFAPTNVGAFLSPVDTNAALYSLATSLDIITIWSLVLLAIGIATVAGVKRSSGYIAVFGWWVLIVLISVGASALMG